MLPQLSALGWFHTLGSLPAVPIGLILLLMHGRIDPTTRWGKAYLVFMASPKVSVLLPSVTETLTRLPAGDPVASGVEDPLVVGFQLTLLVLLILGVTLQFLSRRRRLSSAALA